MRVVAHNAAFELAFLEKAGVTPFETHCNWQTCRLLTGTRRPASVSPTAPTADCCAFYAGTSSESQNHYPEICSRSPVPLLFPLGAK